jgi:hypothetical protein
MRSLLLAAAILAGSNAASFAQQTVSPHAPGAGNGAVAANPVKPPEPAKSVTLPTVNVAAKVTGAQPGDYWHYDARDDILGTANKLDFIVTDITPKIIAVRLAGEGKPDRTTFLTFDHDWNVVSNGRWRFRPSDGDGIPQPLVVGKTWSFHGDAIDSQSHHARRRQLTSKVVAQEKLTTKAGIFDTYRIETSWTAYDTWDSTLRFEYQQTTWFAPAINHWVKRTTVLRTDGLVRERSTLVLTKWGHATAADSDK